MTESVTGSMAESGRVERARQRLEELELDGLLITTLTNRRWLCGFTGSAGVLLLTPTAARIATDACYFEQVAEQAPGWALVPATRGAPWEQAAALLAGLGGAGAHRLGFEPAQLSYAQYRAWTAAIAALPAGERPAFEPAPDAIEALRAVKEPAELAALTRAVRIGDAAFAHAAAVVHAGMTERALAWEVQRHAMEHGADGLSFPTIIAAGARGALPHATPRDLPLEAGQGVVMDLGVVVDGYCSDLTRTIFLGEPDERFRRIYDAVLVAQETAEERIEAGMTGAEAHEVAAAVLHELGYGEQFTHGLGHGVGLDIHEAPSLRPGSDEVLTDGHVVTVEPGVYIAGWGGVRIEDQCVMEGGRLRSLTTAPKLDLTVSATAAES